MKEGRIPSAMRAEGDLDLCLNIRPAGEVDRGGESCLKSSVKSGRRSFGRM